MTFKSGDNVKLIRSIYFTSVADNLKKGTIGVVKEGFSFSSLLKIEFPTKTRWFFASEESEEKHNSNKMNSYRAYPPANLLELVNPPKPILVGKKFEITEDRGDGTYVVQTIQD